MLSGHDVVERGGLLRCLLELIERRIRLRVAQIVGDRSGEDHRVLRDERDPAPEVIERDLADIHAIDEYTARRRIVEAGYKLHKRALAGPRRADDGDPFAGFDGYRHGPKRRMVRTGRIGEGDAFQRDRAPGWLRQSLWVGRLVNHRLGFKQLRDPRGSARRGRHLGPDFRKLAQRTRGEDRIEYELREAAPRHRTLDDRLRPQPEDADHAGENEKDGDGGQQRPRFHRIPRGIIGSFNRAAVIGPHAPPGAENLHGARCADLLGGIGGGLGQRILRLFRAPAHRAARADQRQHDQRDRDQHQRRQLRAGPDHHYRSAEKEYDVAQCDRCAGAKGGFQLGRIGGEARNQLARPRAVKECGVKFGQMVEHRSTQIGDNPLAEGHHEIVAQRTRDREDADHPHEHAEVTADEICVLRREAEIDDTAYGDWNDQRGCGCCSQGKDRRHDPALVGQGKGNERQQAFQRGLVSGCLAVGRHGLSGLLSRFARESRATVWARSKVR